MKSKTGSIMACLFVLLPVMALGQGCGCDGGDWMCDTGCSGGTCVEEGD